MIILLPNIRRDINVNNKNLILDYGDTGIFR